MNKNKTNKAVIGSGVVAAIAASSCCIPPVIAAIAGLSGISSSLSWMEPLRPYLIGFAVVAIGYAWYSNLKLGKEDDCGCDIEKPKFYQTKGFLIAITIFAVVSIGFPYYSSIFFPEHQSINSNYIESNVIEASMTIDGMTCDGCEHSVISSILNQEGVIESSASYEKGTAKVKFDKSKATIDELAEAVENETGYTVTDHHYIN